MSGKTLRFFSLVGCLTLLSPLMGCAMAIDLVSPDFIATLGLDPATVIPSQGRIVIAFKNSTQFTIAECFVSIAVDNSTSAEDYIRISARDIAANETRTMLADCPVGIILPGSAVVQQDAGGPAVEYGGGAIMCGYDYLCGDVIQVEVVQSGDDTATAAFSIEVKVIPGQ